MFLVGAACSLGIAALVNVGAFVSKADVKEVKADAEITGNVYVGSNILTAGVPFNGTTGTIVYTVDAASNQATITLNSFTIEIEGYTSGGYVSALAPTLTSNTSNFIINVVVNGNNSIKETSSGDVKSVGFYYPNYSSTKNIKFVGESTSKLDLYGGSSNTLTAGMHSGPRVVFDGPQITMKSGNVTASSGKGYGLYATNGLEVLSGKVSLLGGNTQVSGTTSYGTYFTDNTVAIKGGEFEAKGDSTGSGTSIGISPLNNGRIVFSGGTSFVYGRNYGIATIDGWSWSTLEIQRSVTDVTIKSNSRAIESDELICLKNATPGTGWLNYDQSDTPDTIAISSSERTISTAYKVLYFETLKVQADISGFSGPYDGNEHSISITNLNPTNATVKYSEDGTYYSSTQPFYTAVGTYTVYYKLSASGYEDNVGSETVTIEGLANDWQTDPVGAVGLVYNNGYQSLLSTLGIAEHGTVEYSVNGGEFSSSTPTAKDAGAYEVTCRINAEPQYYPVANKVVNVTIDKAPNQYKTEPSAVEDQLPYTGEPIVLSVTGSVLGGTVLYKLDTGDYSENLPTATNLGNYTVYYKAVGNENYNDIAERSFNVEIVKGVPTYGVEPTEIAGLHYTGEEQALVSAGTSSDGEVRYSLSQEGPFTTDIPTGIEVGEYTVYYMIKGDGNHEDSQIKNVKAHIAENDKTALVAALEDANALHNEIKDDYPAVAETLKGAIDAANVVNDNKNVTIQQIKDAVDALNVAIEKAIADSRDVIIDEDTGVAIETSDGTVIPMNISLSVEVRADVKAEEGSAERAAIETKLADDEAIAKVFDVKLIKNEGGVETEIQPSDIKDGMSIFVYIDLPSDVKAEGLKILHVHSTDDIEFVENFTLENGQIVFETSKLSELAFINKVDVPAPVDPSGSNNFPGWGIALIVIGAILLLGCLGYLFLFFVLNKWIREDDKALRAFVISKKDGRAKVMVMPFKFVYRDESEVYSSKEDALR